MFKSTIVSYLCFLLVNILTKSKANADVASYCDNDICTKPDKYCCGHNECCTYVLTMWYLWFAFIIGILIGLFLLWKYYFSRKEANIQRANNGASNKKLTSLSSSHQNDKSKSKPFVYMPLNDGVLVEHQVSENTIQFNFVKTSKNQPSVSEKPTSEINNQFLKYSSINY